jgi:hypothetical protein
VRSIKKFNKKAPFNVCPVQCDSPPYRQSGGLKYRLRYTSGNSNAQGGQTCIQKCTRSYLYPQIGREQVRQERFDFESQILNINPFTPWHASHAGGAVRARQSWSVGSKKEKLVETVVNGSSSRRARRDGEDGGSYRQRGEGPLGANPNAVLPGDNIDLYVPTFSMLSPSCDVYVPDSLAFCQRTDSRPPKTGIISCKLRRVALASLLGASEARYDIIWHLSSQKFDMFLETCLPPLPRAVRKVEGRKYYPQLRRG